MTKKQDWHDRIIALAVEMGRDRHIGPLRGLFQAACWTHGAADRMRREREESRKGKRGVGK